MTTTTKTALLPQLTTTAKSFYNKAIVETDATGATTLYSYHVKIATIQNGQVTLYSPVLWSATILRHLKEFLSQAQGVKLNLTKKQLSRYLGQTVSLSDLIKGA
ncbi:MAG: hypothetical protein HXO06_00710 [Prevotella salivae]|uniref:hypothetical protein n=1 Tax=Segatella salivae TaxID=228604 RepID=UPI001CB44B04|nr:hypothetical protein [Segatella salivae]MBF1543698.1 hypothetical protein [Segatella salivae]